MLEVPDVNFIRPCGVVVFALSESYCVVFGLYLFFCWLIHVLSSKAYVCCVCMRDVISEFSEWSFVFCVLMLFLCSIVCLIYSGSSLQMFVKMVFAVCISGSG